MDSSYDIAIVGMSCRFPGARTLDEFWRNLAQGVESISRLSDQEILDSGVPRSYLSKPNYVKAAPILEEPGGFDAAFFGFAPMEAKLIDPQQRILLELAHEALEHAGYNPNCYPGRIAVFTGTALNTYFMSVGLNNRLAEDYIPTLIGNDKDFLSTRISYKLNLKGPSITIQTACSTSLVAIHLACQSLLSEETDMALAGAISVRVPHRAGYFADGGGVVSPDGHVRAFDARGNGTVFGSGGGILVLKRMSDAVSARDTIHAVIKGSAVNNDGSSKAGYTTPSVDSQADTVVEALAHAGVDADSISYIEAHGSGTPVGDPIEITALTKAFRNFTKRSSYCAIGSVKTNVGHLDAAAGVAGVIKTVLALKHRRLPPSLHFTEANPEIDFPRTPFYVNTSLLEWVSEGPRRAGIMSTGMGGTNAHIVIEEAPELPASTDVPSPRLLILSAKTESALDQATHDLRDFLNSNDAVAMSDVVYTLQMGRKAFPYRRYVVCPDKNDAVNTLGQLDSKRVLSNKTDDTRRQVILLLPGIGDHYLGMAHGLYEANPIFRQEVIRCASIIKSRTGTDIREILYPNNQSWKQDRTTKGVDLRKMLGRKTDEPESQDVRNLNQTQFAQPALFTIEYALARLWQSLGVLADAIIGHSMGEYVAACLSGVFSLQDALHLIVTRANLVSGLPPAAMLAVMLPENELLPLLPENLSISLINGPSLCVVAGPIESMSEFERKLNEKSILCRHVQNGHAFHSRMMGAVVNEFEREVRKVQLNEPTIPFISNVTGTWIRGNEATSPGYWAQHVTQTARFSDALQRLWQLDNPILLEAGPGRTLIALALQHLNGTSKRRPTAISSLRPHYENESDVELFLRSVGMLWISGVDIDWESLSSGEGHRIPLPTYPFEREHHWLEPVRVQDGPPQTQLSIEKKINPSEWIYLPSWKRLLPKDTGVHEASLTTAKARKWLLFVDDYGLTSLLVNRLKDAGHDVVTVRVGRSFEEANSRSFVIDPSNLQHYDSLIKTLGINGTLPDRIVHAWSVTTQSSADSGSDAFAQAQRVGFYSLLFLAKALATHNVGHDINLFVLSSNVQDVCGNEILFPEKSTLLGPCVVIRQEYPNICTRSIDVDLSENLGDHKSTAQCVLGELLDASDSNLFIAYRNAHRWVQSYEPVSLDQPIQNGSAFRRGGVYLITGGLGRVGVALSEFLAKNYQAKLVLTGRSYLPNKECRKTWLEDHPVDDPMSVRIRALERIEQMGGEVLYVSSNVADLNGMQAVIEQTYQRFGTLNGVIHGAGLVGDYLEIKDSNFETCERHFQAKAEGLSVLEQVLDGKALDFCLLLSSVASILGGIGEAAYASSNNYMDTFAHKHNRLSPVPWLSVNLDIWLVHDGTRIRSNLGTAFKGLVMSTDEALSVIESVLTAKSASQLIVSTGDLNARFAQGVKLESLNRRGPATAAAKRTRATTVVYGDETEQRIAQIWGDALGIDDIGRHDCFAELGGHSLLAIRIVSELRKAFHIDLPVRSLFDSPTIAELAAYIRNFITAEIDALSEEEVARLLRMSDVSERPDGSISDRTFASKTL